MQKSTSVFSISVVAFIAFAMLYGIVLAGPITPTTGGGTGTSIAPNNGQVLVGQADGTYAPQATSTLGFGGGTVTLAGLTASSFNFFATTTIGVTTSSPNNIYIGPYVAYIQVVNGTAARILSTTSGGTVTLDLATTTPAGSSCTLCGITYDAYGRVTTSTTGTAGTFTTTTISAAGVTLSTTAYIFATSGPAFAISGSGSTLTFSLPTSTASQTGALSSGDWTIFNSKITTTSLSVAYAPLSYNNIIGVFSLPTSTSGQSGFLSSTDWTTFNNKQNNIAFPLPLASTTANFSPWNRSGTNVILATTTDNVGIGTTTPANALTVAGSISQTAVKNSLLAADSTGKLIATTTSVGVTTSTNYHLAQGIFSYASSSSIWDDAIWIPRTTSTVNQISCVNQAGGDTVTLNFYYGASRNTATSSASKTFSSDQTITSTSTPTNITINASSTPGINQPVRMVASNASSTETSCMLYYTEN